MEKRLHFCKFCIRIVIGKVKKIHFVTFEMMFYQVAKNKMNEKLQNKFLIYR